MPATYEPIATTTLGSANGTITFSSIPATYTDLKVIVTGTATAINSELWFRINSDTATNYSNTYIAGSGTAASSGRVTSTDKINLSMNSLLSTSIPFFASVDIFSYAGSTFKTILNSFNNDLNGSGGVESSVGMWRSTSAITSVSVINSTTTFKTGTTATLYGIKAA